MVLLLYVVLASLVGNKWWLPPRGLRAALRFALPPAMAPGASWLRGPGPGRPARSVASLCRLPSAPRFSRWGAWLRGASGCSAPAGAGRRIASLAEMCGGFLRREGRELREEPRRANHGMPLRAGFYRKEGGDLRNCGKEEPGMKQLTRILQDSWKSPVRSSQEAWNVGAGSGYSRDRQARWDAREMRTATTKVRREVYEEFRRLCQ